MKKELATNQRLKFCLSAVITIFFGSIVMFGCSGNNNRFGLGSSEKTSINNISSTSSNTDFSTTATFLWSTPIPNKITLDYIPIKVTQGTVIASTINPESNEYLYKDAIVTFKNVNWNSTIFLNLDNIRDNGQQDSDFLIYIDTGAEGTTFEIYPTNYAKYFFSNSTNIDYESCVANISKTESSNEVPPAEVALGSGKPYCILTNEGRMAIIYMFVDSTHQNDQGYLDLTLNVTVYSKIFTELLTPTPTQRSGFVPTYTNRYAARGLTDDQAKSLDNSIKTFIDAIACGDKNTISQMIDYPVDAIFMNYDIPSRDKEEFLINYENIFNPEITSEIALASVKNNVQVSPERIILKTINTEVHFSDDGKILAFLFNYEIQTKINSE
jgi:hypothetical protein